MKIALGNDHAGLPLKIEIMKHLKLLAVILISVGFLFGCSKIGKLFDKNISKTSTQSESSSD